jgi:hypothetical protein
LEVPKLKIYIDDDFKCHNTNPDGIFREVEDEFFDGKCPVFIEGYRLKPEGETWVREDGEVFTGGKMITPWKDFDELDAAQRQYERQLLAELQTNSIAISELETAYQEGVNSV